MISNLRFIVLLSVGMFLGACKKTTAPVVTLDSVEEVNQELSYTATVDYSGEEKITERGLCWSETNTLPTIDDMKDINGNGSGTFSNVLNDFNLNTDYYLRAYAITSSGTDYSEAKTFNLGRGWVPLNSPVDMDFSTMYFQDENTGHLGGGHQRYYRTTNGGLSWELISLAGNSEKIRDMHFVDENNGFVRVPFYTLKKTTDGGNTWSDMSYPTLGSHRELHFVTDVRGYFIAGNDRLFRTNDGGSTWLETTFVLLGTGDYLAEIYFLNWSTGFVASNHGRVWKTTDSGSNWTEISTSTVESGCQEIYFFDENVGLMICAEHVYKTYDGGVNWELKFEDQEGYMINDMSFYDDQLGYCVGAYGNILVTEDGGETWNVQYNVGGDLYNVHIVSPNARFVSGRNGILLKYE